MSDLLDDTHDISEEMNYIAGELQHLSWAFGATGNKVVEEKLDYMAERLKDHSVKLRKAVSDSIHKGFLQAQQSSINVLNACIAGAELEKRNQQEKKQKP